ncbi:MAG: NADH-quinone oxidoreductase subunit L [Actinomycetia bacterium]|nr:NADH-quinone oxidoreductase subunit L [Actinomycetes bacterium]
MLENAYLVPLLPAISFVVILLFGKRVKGGSAVHWVGITAVGVSFVLSLVIAVQWISRTDDAASAADHGTEEVHVEDEGHSEETDTHEEGLGFGSSDLGSGTLLGAAEEDDHGSVVADPVIEQITWLQIGGVEHKAGTYVDGLSAILLVVVSTVALLVHIYSSEYVRGDRRYVHYYAFLSLFTASMLFFVLSSSILQMIVGWELVGVCSFALIGHWWEDGANSNAALKAFLTNRVGDIGLLIGMVTLFFATGTFDIFTINDMIAHGLVRHFLLVVAATCLVAAAMSKSGQFPLHTWLPDAMAGPTPVSALIHAATMVVAGVYMIARLYPVFYEGFAIRTSSINLLALVGGFTALMAAALAFVQWDIKKVLAYSTVSQLGYMVMALGVGAWTAAVFHLFTHALFKAGLFLGAGSVSHSAGHTFDIREMGGLKKHMPTTYRTFVICSLALAGIFPFAGFWSKDEILLGSLEGQQNGYPLMLIFGCAVAAMTAAYMTRVIWYTFHGEFRGELHHHGGGHDPVETHTEEHHAEPHESPKAITIPLIILAAGAVLAGLANLPGPVVEVFGADGFAHRLQTYAEPSNFLGPLGIIHPDPSLVMALVGLALAVGGAVVTYLFFWKNMGPHGLTERNVLARKGRTLLENKYYLDHLYENVIVAFVKWPLAKAAYWFNQNVLDKIVDTAGESARDGGQWVYTHIDQAVVDGAVNGAGTAAGASGEGLRVIQSGKVQGYGALLFGATAVLAIIFMIVI